MEGCELSVVCYLLSVVGCGFWKVLRVGLSFNNQVARLENIELSIKY